MTPWLDSLVVHPVALWLAGILLVFGVTWLRAAGRLLLVVLGLAAGIAAQGHLVETGVMASGISTFAMVVGLAAALALMAGRHPVLARHAELLFLCGFGLAAAETLGEWLQWPIGAVWCALMVGGLLSPALAVALLATALLSHGLALTSPLWSIVLFGLAACLTIRFRPHRGIFDNRLSRATHTQTTMAAGQPAATGPVILRFNSTASAARFQRRLDRAKVPVERLLGPCLAAKIPASMLARWRFPRLAGLVELVPDGVYAGDTPVLLPEPWHPVGASADDAMPLDEVARCLRSFHGRVLPSDVATGRGKTIAVIDTGVNPSSPLLRRQLRQQLSFVDGEPARDENGHGTAVAAIAVAVAPDASVISLKVLNRNGVGSLYDVLRALNWVGAHSADVDVLNLSFGSSRCGGGDECPSCLAVLELQRRGLLVAAAAGNEGPAPHTLSCPGASSGALAVAAVDRQGRPTRWSSRGPSANPVNPKPNAAAPGERLLVLGRVMSGTSFSTPQAAGLFAALSEYEDATPKTAADVERLTHIGLDACTPAASRDREAVGVGVLNLYCATVGRPAIRWTPIGAAVPTLRRLALAAASVALIAATWRFGFAHVNTVQLSPEPLRLLGRVHELPEGRLLFDDGTGILPLTWAGPDWTRPTPGSVVVLRAHLTVPGGSRRSSGAVLEGLSRYQLATRPVSKDTSLMMPRSHL